MESKADSMASTPTLTRSEEGHQKLAADSVRRSSTISKPPSTHSTHSKSSKDVKATDKGPAPAGPGLQAPIDVPRWRFWAIFISVMLSIFLFALDQLILATATPAIVSDFGALSSLAWMANGFFLTLLGFNLIYSQWNQIFPSKVVLIFAIFIFELGSLVCAVSNSMVVLILGRAITGVGASGLFSGGMIIIAELTPLHNRAQYLGLMGAVFAVASVLGPLIGGAFTDHVSWRWCFYINLPFGGLAIACIALFQPLAPPLGRAATYKGFHRGMIWDVLRCDWVGCGLSMAWAVVLILWLQWGGQEKKWSDGGVITCIVLSIVLIPIFIAYEYWMGERAMFKLALLKRRTISGASILLFWLFGLFMAEVYYISVAFQSVYHISATGAGVRLLPFVMTQIVVLMASSRIVPKIGRFKYVILAGPVFLALGSILLYTVKYGTSISHLMGFEVFLGIGIGLSMQNTMLAVQFELKKEPHLISAGTGLSVFIGFGGRILGLSLAGNIFGNMLKVNLRKYASDLPATLFDAVVSSSDSIWTAVPENLRPGVLKAYAESLRLIYILGLPMACLAVVGGLLIKNSKMQTKEEEMQAIQAAKEKAALAQGEKTGGEGSSKDAVQAGDAERFAEDIAVVAPQPVVSDPRVVLDKSEGKSPV